MWIMLLYKSYSFYWKLQILDTVLWELWTLNPKVLFLQFDLLVFVTFLVKGNFYFLASLIWSLASAIEIWGQNEKF